MTERRTAVVFGGTGGIGAALVRALAAASRHDRIFAGGRRPASDLPPQVETFAFDLTDEASIAAALSSIGGPIDCALVATGMLCDPSRGISPEKTFRAIDPDAMARAFAINAIGPALIARHVLPLLPRDRRAVFAALSAKVGSIGDNRLGGWHSYRASKAALNMLIANFAIELGRTHREAVVAALHPGTVATGLSAPFRSGAAQVFTPDEAAANLLAVLDGLTPADSGGLFAWDGTRLPA